jgi:hypothetical protein
MLQASLEAPPLEGCICCLVWLAFTANHDVA